MLELKIFPIEEVISTLDKNYDTRDHYSNSNLYKKYTGLRILYFLLLATTYPQLLFSMLAHAASAAGHAVVHSQLECSHILLLLNLQCRNTFYKIYAHNQTTLNITLFNSTLNLILLGASDVTLGATSTKTAYQRKGSLLPRVRKVPVCRRHQLHGMRRILQ